MVTMKQIAQQAGVSITTVSNVLHGNTKRVSSDTIQRVQKLLSEHHYVPRQGLRAFSGASSIIGVAAHNTKNFTSSLFADDFYGGIVGALEPCIRKAGYYLMLYSSEEVEDIYRMAAAWNVDGLITISCSGSSYQKLHTLSQKPVVGIDLYDFSPQDTYNVGLEDEVGSFEMTKFLLGNGLYDILFFADADYGVDHQRWLGFRRAFAAAGLPCKKSSFVLLRGGGQRQLRRRFEECAARIGKNTAWFLMSDRYAIEAMHFLREEGYTIPGDISVAGFDNISVSGLVHPPLTTVHQNIETKAIRAFKMLLDLIEGREVAQKNERLPATLFVRNSVRRAEL